MSTTIRGMLSADEAAEILGITPQLVCKYAREGRIPFKTVGKRNRVFERDDIKAFKKTPRKRGNPNFQK